jgi:ABC-type transport system involved in Fe-S cluster assembly fused permease/ATPase subunit
MTPLNEGSIFIDGRDVAHVTLRQLRSSIGVVSQQPFLFEGVYCFACAAAWGIHTYATQVVIARMLWPVKDDV